MKKKQKSQCVRRIFELNSELEQQENHYDQDTQENSEQDDNQQYYSIIEWKKLQDERVQQMVGINMTTSEISKGSNYTQKKQNQPLKSCLKQIKKEDVILQYQGLIRKISQDQLQTVISSEKLKLNQQQIKQCIIVTEFNNIMNDDDEISITLDELDDFIQERHTDQKKNSKFDISKFDSIKKIVELNQNIQ